MHSPARRLPLWIALVVLLAVPAASSSPRVAVEGLMPNAAVLNVDGQRKMLRVGQSFGGVTLLATDGKVATLEVGGEKISLGLSQRIGTQYQVPSTEVVQIPADAQRHYTTTIQINGRSVLALVDTGATLVSMSKRHADFLGVNYRLGTPGRSVTASGIAENRLVTLDSVAVGGIRINNVRASVGGDDFPRIVLLGMSYLSHVTMTDKDGVLTLTRTK